MVKDCGIDNLSISGSSGGGGGPVGPTPCAYSLPFSQNFNSGSTIPTGWTSSQTSGDGWRFQLQDILLVKMVELTQVMHGLIFHN